MEQLSITIGALARAAGVNVETIRYYQRRGLLKEPEKPLGGIRRYSMDSVGRVRFIKRAQALGFTLEEIASLLKLEDGRHCAETRDLAARKLALIEARIVDLKAMEKALKGLIRECDAGSQSQSCPLIASLVGEAG